MLSKNNKKRGFPSLKKDIKAFLTSEEGNINKKNAAKISMGVLAVGIGLAGAMKPDVTEANCFHASHSSHGSHGSHASHASHGSHGSHASHSSHGSHGSHASHASHGSHGS